VADLLEEAIAVSEPAASRLATVFGFTGRMFVIGRGLEFATARELALKLTETCGIAAEPMTATDLVHGPIAALDPMFPVWAIASNDAGLPAVQEAAQRATDVGATVVASGSAAEKVEGAAYRLPIPEAPAPLDPLLSIVPGQVFAWALSRVKGLDPDRPTHLTKVTLAK
jgi:glucosamine--fructose-6-phosphate aminotransferase (isomerizing)